MKNSRRWNCSTLITCLVLVSGCSIIPRQQAAQISFYRLKLPASPVASESSSFTVGVTPLSISSLYSRNSLVHVNDSKVGVYINDQWISPPAQLVTDALVAHLTEWKYFNAVWMGGTVMRPDYTISGIIETFGEQRRGTQSYARVVMSLTVADQAYNRTILLQKNYVASSPCVQGNPDRLVQELTTCVNHIFTELRADIRNIIPPPDTKDGKVE